MHSTVTVWGFKLCMGYNKFVFIIFFSWVTFCLHVLKLLCICAWIVKCIFEIMHKSLYTFVNLIYSVVDHVIHICGHFESNFTPYVTAWTLLSPLTDRAGGIPAGGDISAPFRTPKQIGGSHAAILDLYTEAWKYKAIGLIAAWGELPHSIPQHRSDQIIT